jgi:uncharacterized protein YbaP (TraB family)
MKHLSFCVIFSLMMALGYAQAPVEKALLWKITGKNMVQPSYLFGTNHALCPEDGQIPDKIKQILSACSSLYGENPPHEKDFVVREHPPLTLPDGYTLKSFIPADKYDEVARIFLEKTHLPLETFSDSAPILASTSLSAALNGCTTPVFLDGEIVDLAKSKSIPIFGLEPQDSSLIVLEKQIPFQAQADLLMKMLLNWEQAKEQAAKELTWYKTQDIESLELDIHNGDFRNYAKYLLDIRNRRWIPVIEKAVLKGPVLFAVGCAHLAGEYGLIKLLRDKGFTVTPVMGPLYATTTMN